MMVIRDLKMRQGYRRGFLMHFTSYNLQDAGRREHIKRDYIK